MSAAKLMHPIDRLDGYMRQNGSLLLTPRQARRAMRKLRRWWRQQGGDAE